MGKKRIISQYKGKKKYIYIYNYDFNVIEHNTSTIKTMRNDNNNDVLSHIHTVLKHEHTAVLNTLIRIENNGELLRQRVP